MTKHEKTLADARNVLKIEAEAVLALAERIDGTFVKAIDKISSLRGKVVASGLGKSGHVARKIAATMASTGTPAIFMHPVEAVHGDLGIVSANDLLLLISNSGENDEILILLAAAKNIGAATIAMTGDTASTLGKNSDLTLDVGVDCEACPLGLAPTASTTAAMAMGDAMAVALMNRREFGKDDFAVFHPGGKLGQRLALKISDIMLTGDKIPVIPADTPYGEALKLMSEISNLGVILIVDAKGLLSGIYTDGDIRRTVISDRAWKHTDPIANFMSKSPRTVDPDAPASEALQMMEARAITSLAIVDSKGRPAGIIHLHDILGRGKFTI